jgi:heptosyltransferase-2
MNRISGANINKIVVRGTNWVGDAVMTVPALRALRRLFPEAEITLATRPWAKGLFAEADFIDDILVYDRKGAFSAIAQSREWRQKRFDLAVLFQNAFEAALIPFLAGVPFKLGYATEKRSFLLTHPIELPEWRSSKHEVFYYLYLVAALEQAVSGSNNVIDHDPDISLSLSEFSQAQASALLRSNGLVEGKGIVAICPGSINSRAKRWPPERFAALADRLLDDNRKVVLIGSEAEQEVSDEVTKRMKHHPVVLTGKTNLEQLTALLGLVDLVVTNDTGPAHIAAALGRPTIVIFGPTNPLTTRPFSPLAEVVRHPPDCAPCMLRDCPIDHRCMTAITVDEIFEKSVSALKRTSFARTVRSVCDPVA